MASRTRRRLARRRRRRGTHRTASRSSRPTGGSLGDSEFDEPALSRLENHSSRPEISAALRSDSGSSIRNSPSAGDEEIYAAVRTPLGIARVSLATRAQEAIVARLQRDVLVVALGATLLALLLSFVIARSITRPVLELRDDAKAIAAGDLERRPALNVSGEIGELATAFHQLAEQLSTRLRALEADDALLRALMDSLNEGAVALDSRQQVVHVNAQARRLLGVRDEVPFPADQLPRDRALRSAIAAAIAGESIDGLELTLHGRTVTLTARPLASGGAVLALFDLTPLRRLETVRSDFVANVSHELKTPLTVVGGFAETLGDDTLEVGNAAAVRFGHTIEHQAHAAHRRRPARPVAHRVRRLVTQDHDHRHRVARRGRALRHEDAAGTPRASRCGSTSSRARWWWMPTRPRSDRS